MSQVFKVDSVVFADSVSEVGQQWYLERAKPSFFARGVHPRKVGEMRVDRAPNHLSIDLVELLDAIVESQNFRWTNKRTEI